MEHRDELIDALVELLPRSGKRRCHGSGERSPDDSMPGRTLHKLYDNGGSLTPGELREMLDVTGARVTAILKELEGKGKVRRCPGPEDKRSVLVTLTEEGRQAVEAHLARRRARVERILDRLGRDDAEALVRLLRAVRAIDEENGDKE